MFSPTNRYHREYDVNGNCDDEEKQMLLFNNIKPDLKINRNINNKAWTIQCCLSNMKLALEIAYILYTKNKGYAMILRFKKQNQKPRKQTTVEIELAINPTAEQKEEPGKKYQKNTLSKEQRIKYSDYLEDLEEEEPKSSYYTQFSKKITKSRYKVAHLIRSSESQRQDSLKKY